MKLRLKLPVECVEDAESLEIQIRWPSDAEEKVGSLPLLLGPVSEAYLNRVSRDAIYARRFHDAAEIGSEIVRHFSAPKLAREYQRIAPRLADRCNRDGRRDKDR